MAAPIGERLLWPANLIEPLRAVRRLRVGKLVLAGAGGTFRHVAEKCPVAREIGGGVDTEADA